VRNSPVPLKFIQGWTYDVMNISELLILASGTATLEAALLGKPMIIIYKISLLSSWVGRVMIQVKHKKSHMLHFHNTFSRRKEPFQPLVPGEVKMYTCGPTVYDFVHIGNLRTFLFEDLLRRYLKYKGYQVTQVMTMLIHEDRSHYEV
jgi:HJR/Mrr/RecB family endonuclease